MSEPGHESIWNRFPSHIETPELDAMGDEEVALDWVRKVLDLPVDCIDANPRILSEEGRPLVRQVRASHRTKYKDLPCYNPNDTGLGLLFSYDHEEAHRRDVELEVEIRKVTDNDPGVMAKNRFLAMIADLFSGTAASQEIVEMAEDIALDSGHILPEEEKDELANLIQPFAKLRAAPMMSMLVGMRRYAEAVGNNPTIYQDQFLGLWAIFSAGQESARLSSGS